MTLVPNSFKAPEKAEFEKFIVRKLCASDVYLDYMAVMSSIDIIQKTRGGSWPTPELTFEDDLIDLSWHQREFEHKSSFAYTVMSKNETECLGCFYFYPVGFRGKTSEVADVDISFWVTQKAYNNGLYPELYKAIIEMIKNWPFKKPHWSNKEIPA
jgi:hypothetical protein